MYHINNIDISLSHFFETKLTLKHQRQKVTSNWTLFIIITITSLKDNTANPFRVHPTPTHYIGVFFDFKVGLSGPSFLGPGLSGTGLFLPDSANIPVPAGELDLHSILSIRV